MDKQYFFSNNLIQSYINELSRNLLGLPQNIIEQHILEIKSDLYENAIEKSKAGFLEREIPQYVVTEFLSPQKLAIEIIEEYGEIEFSESNRAVNFIKYYTALSMGSLGAMAIPIAMGGINISANLPFALAFIFSNVWIIFGKIPWNITTLNFLKRIMKIRDLLIAIAFGCFAIRIIIAKEIESFTLYYFMIYLLVLIMYIMFLKSFYKRKQA
ncbi:hypothetical protein [Neobacillus sp. PS3-40]|uniref:hypothetical protein n=1 Tax=Neobacillus sp. PS3-40 TaxID=3070679 RepID=UPI0027E18EB5|nr:hypothetical protein [Neobacillus sp. PS3-40]WML43846.1 hypothetical protein RCG20_18990 [Neobacillus sp. PS3-40]